MDRLNTETYEIQDIRTKDSEDFRVNSLHHQAIHVGELLSKPESGLRATYISDDYLVEAMEHVDKPIISVQFHPEELLTNDYSNDSIKKLLDWKK